MNFEFCEFCGCHQETINFKLGEDGKVPSSWILIDNQSTIDVFYKIRRVSTKMNSLQCRHKYHKYGGTVWYHKNGIANILSLAKVCRDHEVKFDSVNGYRFEVKK